LHWPSWAAPAAGSVGVRTGTDRVLANGPARRRTARRAGPFGLFTEKVSAPQILPWRRHRVSVPVPPRGGTSGKRRRLGPPGPAGESKGSSGSEGEGEPKDPVSVSTSPRPCTQLHTRSCYPLDGLLGAVKTSRSSVTPASTVSRVRTGHSGSLAQQRFSGTAAAAARAGQPTISPCRTQPVPDAARVPHARLRRTSVPACAPPASSSPPASRPHRTPPKWRTHGTSSPRPRWPAAPPSGRPRRPSP
jgi:hypothetical protein